MNFLSISHLSRWWRSVWYPTFIDCPTRRYSTMNFCQIEIRYCSRAWQICLKIFWFIFASFKKFLEHARRTWAWNHLKLFFLISSEKFKNLITLKGSNLLLLLKLCQLRAAITESITAANSIRNATSHPTFLCTAEEELKLFREWN